MKKKILCLLSVLALSVSVVPYAYAASVETGEVTESNITSEKVDEKSAEESELKVDLGLFNPVAPGASLHYENPIPAGFSIDELKNYIVKGGDKVEPDSISEFDTNKVGKHEVTITVAGKEYPMTVEVVKMRAVVTGQLGMYSAFMDLPVNGNVRYAYSPAVFLVNAEDELGDELVDDMQRFLGASMVQSLEEFPFDFTKIDTSKPGIKEYTVDYVWTTHKIKIPTTLTMKVRVGMPNLSSKEQLLTQEEIAAMPKGDEVGIWEVPSGKAGEGMWIFPTGLHKGSEVTVWSCHEGKWLKVGVYAADSKGDVTVSFTADQLSPILIIDNKKVVSDEHTDKEQNTGTTDKGQDTGVDAANQNVNQNARVTSPKTGDNTSIFMQTVITLLLAVEGIGITITKSKR